MDVVNANNSRSDTSVNCAKLDVSVDDHIQSRSCWLLMKPATWRKLTVRENWCSYCGHGGDFVITGSRVDQQQ